MDYIKYEKNNFKSIHQIFVDAIQRRKPIFKEILRIFTTLNQNNVQLSDHCTFIFVTRAISKIIGSLTYCTQLPHQQK